MGPLHAFIAVYPWPFYILVRLSAFVGKKVCVIAPATIHWDLSDPVRTEASSTLRLVWWQLTRAASHLVAQRWSSTLAALSKT